MTEGSFRQRNKIQPTGKLSQVFAEITARAGGRLAKVDADPAVVKARVALAASK